MAPAKDIFANAISDRKTTCNALNNDVANALTWSFKTTRGDKPSISNLTITRNRRTIVASFSVNIRSGEDINRTGNYAGIYYSATPRNEDGVWSNLDNKLYHNDLVARTTSGSHNYVAGALKESTVVKPNGDYNMSILKSNMGKPQCLRFFFEYPADAGLGHFLHTYKCDGNPIPSFEGEPTPVDIFSNDIDEFTAMVWDNLNEDNKVSLFVRYIDIASGKADTRIINKYEKA